jgi:4-amino-4-deoxy-L-arabinose transferase-like glycosyltransferase
VGIFQPDSSCILLTFQNFSLINNFFKDKTILQKLLFILFIILSFTFCFYNLNSLSISLWDEYTNFNVIYSTIENKSLPYLMLNNKYFFEKPPLWYFLSLFNSQIFGLNNFSLRLISAFSSFFIILITFYIGYKIFSYKAGLVSGFVMLASRHLFINNSNFFSTHTFRSADLDALQLLFILLTSFALFEFNKNNKTFYFAVASIFTSFGFMTKGFISLLPVFIYFIYLILNTNKKLLKIKISYLIYFLTIFLIFTLPWHLLMFLKFKDLFIERYFIYHVLIRSISTIEEHYGKIFYYFYILFRKDFFFSMEFLIISIIYLIKKYKQKISRDFNLFFPLSFVFFILIIFTLVQTKLAWYILPIYPFASLVIGKFFSDFFLLKNKKYQNILNCIFILILTIQILSNFALILIYN